MVDPAGLNTSTPNIGCTCDIICVVDAVIGCDEFIPAWLLTGLDNGGDGEVAGGGDGDEDDDTDVDLDVPAI